jgi:hypothetical protein
MAKSGKTQSKLADLNYSLGGFDWVNGDATLWPSFAHWLTDDWYKLYRPAFDNLPGIVVDLRNGKQIIHKAASLTWDDAYPAMEKAVAKLADELPKHSSRKQLALIHTQAVKMGLTATHRQLPRRGAHRLEPRAGGCERGDRTCANQRRRADA